MSMHKDIKPFLQNLRKKKNITQQEVADKLFVSRATYASWEKDEGKICLEMFIKICRIFEVNITDLFDLTDVEQSKQVQNIHFLKKYLMHIENRISIILSKI